MVLTIGLYNTYNPDVFEDAMRRAIARAAPVCLAFDCNLATFGVPYMQANPRLTSPRAIAEFIGGSTSIGGGEAIKQLAAEGRFRNYDYPQGMFPPQLGTAIVTSEHGQPHTESVSPDALPENALAIFGLGPHGLPDEILQAASHSLELTGRNIALETATAIAILPALASRTRHD